MLGRRQLLRAVAAIPLALRRLGVNSSDEAPSAKLEDGTYIIFVPAGAVDYQNLAKTIVNPKGRQVVIVPVEIPEGMTMDDVVRLYKLESKTDDGAENDGAVRS